MNSVCIYIRRVIVSDAKKYDFFFHICGKNFSRKDNLVRHLKTHLQSSGNNEVSSNLVMNGGFLLTLSGDKGLISVFRQMV